MNATSFVLASCLAASLVMAGCSAEAPMQSARDPKLPAPGADKQYHVVFPDEGSGKARYIHIALGGDVSQDCGLMQAHFEFNSDDPLPQDKVVLKSVADCLNTPALHGKTLSIVGRADARGGQGYNLQLGARRAEMIKQLLVDSGVDANRIITSSTGDVGSVGGDGKLYSYGYDRRVDVMITGVTHAPH